MRPRLLVAILLLSEAQLVPLASYAQQDLSPSSLALAQKLTDEGHDLGTKGQWAEALQKFQAAANIHSTAQVQFYIGVSESRLGKVVEASVALHRAMELGQQAGLSQVVDAAKAELGDVENRTPTVTLTLPANAQPTSLTVDGSAMAVAAIGSPLPLDPGDHTIIVGFANGNTTKTATLKEAQRLSLPIEVPEGTAPPATTTTTGVTSPPPPSGRTDTPGGEQPVSSGASSSRTTIGWTLVGVGAAGLITSGIFLGLYFGALSDNDALCPNHVCQAKDEAAVNANADSARSRGLVSGIAGGVGAVAAGIGIYLLATGGSHGSATTGAHVSPWLGPGVAGASLSGSF